MYQQVEKCRCCGADFKRVILDYGVILVADALSPRAWDDRYRAPLSLYQCPACSLLQLDCHLEPASIFNERYPYFSSEIDSLVDRMQKLAAQLIERYQLDRHSRVVEIASNDGYLLQHFSKAGIPVLGIEPCMRQCGLANKRGINTLCAFFGSEVSGRLRAGGAADLVVANNVVAHVPDINDFIVGIASLLSDKGTAVFEFHYARRMLEQGQFDTLYHQHIFYYTLTSFSQLLERHGLAVKSVEQIESYGGSLRVHADRHSKADHSVHSLLASEAEYFSQPVVQQFALNCQQKSHALRQAILDLRSEGKRIVGYGAAAKASTLLGVCNLGAQQLDYLVDQNSHKHGLFMPGTNLQVYPVSELRSNRPDYILIFAWNYADEIMQQLEWFREQGGRFIIPLPKLQIL